MTEESHTPTTGMEHATEQAAWIIHGCTGDEDGAPVAARALAEAGLLAPAPLREEWACRYTLRSGKVKTRREATERAAREWIGIGEGQPAILRRYRTDWMPVNRAEGDGRAET